MAERTKQRDEPASMQKVRDREAAEPQRQTKLKA